MNWFVDCWNHGINFEDLADGYGTHEGARYDWSAIRDSSDEAIARMLERTLSLIVFQARK